MRIIFGTSIIIAVLFVAFIFLPGPSGKKSVVIQHGSLVRASQTLKKEKVIYSEILFFIPAKIANYFKTLRAGEYKFGKNVNIYQIIKKMQLGDVVFHKLSVPEGLTSKRIVDLVNNEYLLSGIITDSKYPEGSLLPETYYFTRGEQKQIMLSRMQHAMTDTVDKIWQERYKNTPLKTKEELVTLASIVEEEAKSDEDRKKVASVFINRLNRGMKLQADPTVIFAITKGQYKLDRRLTSKDLDIASPWNTYYASGLPPTPISNPGADSLAATATPIKTNYLFFVVNDCKGNHAFASTYREHQKNVRLYRKLDCN